MGKKMRPQLLGILVCLGLWLAPEARSAGVVVTQVAKLPPEPLCIPKEHICNAIQGGQRPYLQRAHEWADELKTLSDEFHRLKCPSRMSELKCDTLVESCKASRDKFTCETQLQECQKCQQLEGAMAWREHNLNRLGSTLSTPAWGGTEANCDTIRKRLEERLKMLKRVDQIAAGPQRRKQPLPANIDSCPR